MAAEQSELRLARLRVELARKEFETTRRKVAVGAAGRETLAASAAELQEMESNLARIQLNLNEIRATAQAPRNDLAAPVVGQNDFVRERMELELAAAQKQMVAAEANAKEAKLRSAAGVASRLVTLEALAASAQQKAEMEMLMGKLQLREEYLQQKLTASQAARREQSLELQKELRVAQGLREVAQARLAKVQQMWKAGTVEQVDLLRAQLEASERNADAERLRQSLQQLESARP